MAWIFLPVKVLPLAEVQGCHRRAVGVVERPFRLNKSGHVLLDETNCIASIMKYLNSKGVVLLQGILLLVARTRLTQAKGVINMQKQDNIA